MPMHSEFPFGKGKGKKSAKERGEDKVREAKERKEADERTKKIASQVEKDVLEKLGTPPGFIKIVAHPLWDDRFRVNVWAEGRISDSYFVHAVEDGITRCDPPVPKGKYTASKSCLPEDIGELQSLD